MSDVLDRAAAVRRSVTPRVLGFASHLSSNSGMREALAVCRFLTPDNAAGAVSAHRTLVGQLRADLADVGMTDEETLRVATALVNFLDAAGHVFVGGRWVLKESEEDPARGLRLASVG
jgi:hypothetical protein